VRPRTVLVLVPRTLSVLEAEGQRQACPEIMSVASFKAEKEGADYASCVFKGPCAESVPVPCAGAGLRWGGATTTYKTGRRPKCAALKPARIRMVW
jgi:hypothetical protein